MRATTQLIMKTIFAYRIANSSFSSSMEASKRHVRSAETLHDDKIHQAKLREIPPPYAQVRANDCTDDAGGRHSSGDTPTTQKNSGNSRHESRSTVTRHTMKRRVR